MRLHCAESHSIGRVVRTDSNGLGRMVGVAQDFPAMEDVIVLDTIVRPEQGPLYDVWRTIHGMGATWEADDGLECPKCGNEGVRIL